LPKLVNILPIEYSLLLRLGLHFGFSVSQTKSHFHLINNELEQLPVLLDKPAESQALKYYYNMLLARIQDVGINFFMKSHNFIHENALRNNHKTDCSAFSERHCCLYDG
jgi:hypothetical protein